MKLSRMLIFESDMKSEKPPVGTYPNHIRQIRDSLGIKQDPLKHALKISQPAISDLENGRTRLSVENAMIVASVLKCNFWELSEELTAAFGDQAKSSVHSKKKPDLGLSALARELSKGNPEAEKMAHNAMLKYAEYFDGIGKDADPDGVLAVGKAEIEKFMVRKKEQK